MSTSKKGPKNHPKTLFSMFDGEVRKSTVSKVETKPDEVSRPASS